MNQTQKNANVGSQTQTETPSGSESLSQGPTPILRLRNSNKPKKPEVKWAEGTIDNEHMNKKKTKICCIFHPADGGESCDSSESSESDASDAEGSNDPGPNAYEKQPRYQKH